MKRYRFWFDTETSGRKAKDQQILEYAVIVEDQFGVEAERLEVRIKLREGIKPEPQALEINQINPWGKVWTETAIPEEDAARKLKALAEKYTDQGFKPILTAYNASFDTGFVDEMFKRYGFRFADLFNKSVCDPMVTAKKLVKSGKIKTMILTTQQGKSYSSAKLEHVALALNFYRGGNHRAMVDIEMLRDTTRAMYQMIINKPLYENPVGIETFVKGQPMNVVTDSSSSGVKKRSIFVLDNNVAELKITAFDLDDYEENGVAPSNIRTFNYGTIIQHLPMDEVDSYELTRIVSLHYNNEVNLSKAKPADA